MDHRRLRHGGDGSDFALALAALIHGVGGKVQHGIYVGDADDRHVIFFKAHRAPGAKGAWSKLGFGSFDEFAGV